MLGLEQSLDLLFLAVVVGELGSQPVDQFWIGSTLPLRLLLLALCHQIGVDFDNLINFSFVVEIFDWLWLRFLFFCSFLFEILEECREHIVQRHDYPLIFDLENIEDHAQNAHRDDEKAYTPMVQYSDDVATHLPSINVIRKASFQRVV